MKKDFSLQSFKSSASNASDFLKTKGYDIPRSLMLNTFSVFMGMKNWNTAQAMLSNEKENKKQDILDEIIKSKNGLVLISSKDPQKIINYIHNVISIKLIKETRDSKILRSQVFEKYYKDLDNNIYDNIEKESTFLLSTYIHFESYFKKNGKNIVYNFLRRDPDYIILDLLTDSEQLMSTMNAAYTGHLVFLGVDLKNKNNAKEELFEMLIKKDNVKLNDVLNLNDVIKEIIHLD